jgi:hypothetical protein
MSQRRPKRHSAGLTLGEPVLLTMFGGAEDGDPA